MEQNQIQTPEDFVRAAYRAAQEGVACDRAAERALAHVAAISGLDPQVLTAVVDAAVARGATRDDFLRDVRRLLRG